MGFRKGTAVSLVVLMMVGMLQFAHAGSAKEQKAEAAALAWLKLVDNGEYAASWDDAAAYFKNAISKKKWEQSLSAVRKPLGDMRSRKLKSATYVTRLPGAPDGEYVVIQFDTSFQNKDSAVETVHPDEGQRRKMESVRILHQVGRRPLIEPGVRISRIRISTKRWPEAMHREPIKKGSFAHER